MSLAHVANAEQPQVTIREFPIGDSRITARVRDYGPANVLFCNLHDDENTSVEAADHVLREHPGRLVEISHSGDRNCRFNLNGTGYVFDPNRMFTPAGVRKTLEKQGDTSPAAEKQVERFGQALLELYKLADVSIVVALHNNTDARYSAANYLPGNEYASDAADVYILDGSDTDDFFFVTERWLFEALKARQQNVVLQNNEAVTDDGSLSVYCGQQGKAYVNVEAQHGHLEQQIEMLNKLLDVIAARETE